MNPAVTQKQHIHRWIPCFPTFLWAWAFRRFRKHSDARATRQKTREPYPSPKKPHKSPSPSNSSPLFTPKKPFESKSFATQTAKSLKQTKEPWVDVLPVGVLVAERMSQGFLTCRIWVTCGYATIPERLLHTLCVFIRFVCTSMRVPLHHCAVRQFFEMATSNPTLRTFFPPHIGLVQ